ncbi:hypothetical protein [Saccharibacillus sp. O23]|uniref:hypothetical protein n=1 Tax=Saccharibacillus sp. O23 TaxID=2009338 RepID=UPI00117B7906|nr:hypothetical protein [Saccharibacillus sp. O23]
MTIRIRIPKEMETEMYYIQVKKYSPLTKGQTTKKKIRTWTSIHDIGNFYHGSKLTQEEYLHIEDKYVTAVNLYLDFKGIDSLEIRVPDKIDEELFAKSVQKYPKCYGEDLAEFYYSLSDHAFIQRNFIEYAIRLSLREDIYSQMRRDHLFFVECNYDLYMDIGSDQKDETIIKEIENLGLYVNVIDYEYPNNFWTRSE